MDYSREFTKYILNVQKGGSKKSTTLPNLTIIKNKNKNNKDINNPKINEELDDYIFQDNSNLNSDNDSNSDLSENDFNSYKKYQIQLSDSEDEYAGDSIDDNIGMQIAAGSN